MQQVLIIHGGSSFNSYESYIRDLRDSPLKYEKLLPQQKWKPWIAEQMPDADVLLPTLPNSKNAVYEEWKIYFEKILPYLDLENTQLVGHSLGAMFLAIYLNETTLAKRVKRLILVSPAYADESVEELGSFKVTSAKHAMDSAEELHLFHSQDDPVVPYTELAKFELDLPSAIVHRFNSRGHFSDPTFPELLELLKQK
ncbi:alpha/beta hydrolase [Candidatus Saccharibacteria bacterium]|nr:alpha/beta hydrolase [Candidatus Saccharibacteria bacterium]MBH1972464.1 alpha/beta hydrolase [Candidatus Saccharibacteria bacterium]MBH1990194.1 alpha/beta hydrolase [Candidatus Saccharibacteria bacterium]